MKTILKQLFNRKRLGLQPETRQIVTKFDTLPATSAHLTTGTLIVLALTLSACSKSQWQLSYEAHMEETKEALSSSTSMEQWHQTQHASAERLAQIELQARSSGNSICETLSQQPLDELNLIYLTMDSNPVLHDLPCRDEVIHRVEAARVPPSALPVAPNVEYISTDVPLPYDLPGNAATPSSEGPSSLPGPVEYIPSDEPLPYPTPDQKPTPAPKPVPVRPIAAPQKPAMPPVKPAPQASPGVKPPTPAAPHKNNQGPLGIDSQTGTQNVRILEPTGGRYTFAGLKKKQLALTFDDGPHHRLTPALLAILNKEGVSATFFTIGNNVLQFPKLVKEELAEGHSVGSHTQTHPNLPKLTEQEAEQEIRMGFGSLLKVLGKVAALFRFPYGAATPALSKFVESRGISDAFWAIDSLDWKNPNPAILLDRTIKVINETEAGIILFHDIQPQTIQMMPALLQYLRHSGYKTFALKSSGMVLPQSPTPLK